MTFFEFTKSLLDSTRDRMKTPIAGAYTFSFIVYNWKPIIYLLFSKAAIEKKLTFIENNYSGWSAVLVPLAIAAIYIIVVHYIMWLFDYLNKWAKKGRRTAHYEYKVHDLKKLGDVLQQEYDNEGIRAGKREKQALNDEIEKLNSEIEKMREHEKNQYEDHQKELNNQKAKEKLISDEIFRIQNVEREKTRIEVIFLTDIMKKFKQEELKLFIDYVQSNIQGVKSKLIYIQDDTKDFYIEQGLIDGNSKLTDKGQLFYDLVMEKIHPTTKPAN